MLLYKSETDIMSVLQSIISENRNSLVKQMIYSLQKDAIYIFLKIHLKNV